MTIGSWFTATVHVSRMPVLAILTCVTAIGIPAVAQAQVYSLSGDWSDAANPNGAWSYGPGLSHYAQPSSGPANDLNATAANGYWGSGPDFFSSPFMVKVTANGSSTGAYNDNDFLAGDVVVHSPNSGAPTSITWTAPSAGSIALISSVWYAHSIVSRSDDILALLNGTMIGSATVTNGITRASQLTLVNGSFTVAAGDVLTFDFTKSAGQQFGSIAGISATIDFTPDVTGAVPEPATWAMMILGFGMIGVSLRGRSATGQPKTA